MSGRHLGRTIVLQTLFEWDFNNKKPDYKSLLEKNIKNSEQELKEIQFTENLISNIMEKIEEIDEIIKKYAPEWPIQKITIIDRNILRIGIYELYFNNEIPPKVAIDESIELSKSFGGDSSYRFINGVLGSIYKDLNKSAEDTSKKLKDIKLSPNIKEISVGAIVYRKDGDKTFFVLIKDAINKWTFPKGKIGLENPDETIKEAIEREILEETGIKKIEIKTYVDYLDVTVNQPAKPSYRKRLLYYLAETEQKDIQYEDSVTVKDAKWFDKDETIEVLGYKESKSLFKKALKKMDEIIK